MLLDGCSRDRASEELVSDALGSHPLDAFRDSVTTLRSGLEQPGALERACTHPLFDTTGARLLRGRATDVAIRAWDLAHTLGGDEHLDPRLVEHALQHYVEAGDLFVKSGAVAPPTGPTDPSVAPQTRLLRLAGRNA
jgi:hypothetical protein